MFFWLYHKQHLDPSAHTIALYSIIGLAIFSSLNKKTIADKTLNE
jgi:hypothetical protein